MDCVHCSHLPQSVLVHILQHVPLQARLQHCALVSTAWAAAAAAATTHLTHRFPATAEAGHAKSMLRWIAKHGQEITSLQLLGRDRGLVLPFSRQLLPNLRCLAIQDLAVFVGSFSGRPADAVFISAAATAAPPAAAAAAAGAGRHMPQTSVPLLLASKQLTRLELVNCRLLPQAQALPSLTVLSVLTDLQHLKLAVQSGDGVQGWSWNELVAQQERMQQVLAGMWSSLTRLTHLDLSRQAGVSAAAVADMTALTHLQDLLINNTMHLLQPTSLAPLQHLTALSLLHIDPVNMGISSSSTPFLTSLPNLAQVVLLGIKVLQPGLLLSIPKLRSLQLHVAHSFPMTVRELMLALAQCTALTELRLGRDVPTITSRDLVSSLAAGPGPGSGRGGPVHQRQLVQVKPQDFAAITASPVLQRLEIESSSIYTQSWQHIFQKNLMQLRHLRLSNMGRALDTAGLGLMVARCPNLTSLALYNVLRYDATLECLVQLQQLRHLTVVCGGGEPPVDALKQLTGLHSLNTGCDERHVGMRWTATSLLELSALQYLTRFEGCRHGTQRHDNCTTRPTASTQRIERISQTPMRLMPDVWCQLVQERPQQAADMSDDQAGV